MNRDTTLDAGRIETSLSCPMRKYKFPLSKIQFLINAFGKEYLLCLGQTSGYIVTFEEGLLKLQKEFNIPSMNVIDIVSTGNGDINILHSKGVYRQFVDQLIHDASFRGYEFDQSIEPLKLVVAEDHMMLIVCKDSRLVVMKNDKVVKSLQIPSKMMMENLVLDHEKRDESEPRLVVPCRDLTFPYVFSVRQLSLWEQNNYLQKVTEICEKYYEFDEKLTPKYSGMCFSAAQDKIYVCLTHEVLILNVKKTAGGEGVDYFTQARMRVQTNWKELPFYTRLSSSKGSYLIIEKEKIADVCPTDYTRPKLRLKQKRSSGNGMIVAGWRFDSGRYVFLMLDSEETRFMVLQP